MFRASIPFTRCAHWTFGLELNRKVGNVLANGRDLTTEIALPLLGKRAKRRSRLVESDLSTFPSTAVQELNQISLAQRDIRLFAPLYEEYADLVWRYAMSRLGDQERAADATSITFAKAIAALPGFRPELRESGTTFRSWLMSIARNVVTDSVRSERPVVSLDDTAVRERLVDRAVSPEDRAIAIDGEARIEAALAQLSEVQRHIVELRAAGLKGIEIAEVLEMNVAAVRTAHFRAYAKLRVLLGDRYGDRGTNS